MSLHQPAKQLAMVFAVAAAALILPYIAGQIRLASNLDYFNDGGWLNYQFFRFYDPALFPDDYAGRYYLSFWMTPGFVALNYLWAQLADPLLLHRALPVVLWLGCAPFVFTTAKKIGGRANAWATVGMYLTSSVFLQRFVSSLPHSFSPFFVWWGVAALVSSRPLSLAICTIVSAAFYPIVTPVTGVMLAIWMLFTQRVPCCSEKSTVSSWTLKRRFLFLCAAGLLTLLAILPMAQHLMSGDYGRTLNFAADQKAFPEMLNYPSPHPLTMLLMIYHAAYSARLGSVAGAVMMIAGFVVLAVGQGVRNTNDRRPQLLIPFIVAMAVICIAGSIFDYANAYRYVVYTVPVWITLELPLSLRRISRRFMPVGKKAPVYMAMTLIFMSCFAKTTPEASGYSIKLDEPQKHAAEFVQTLPKDALLAGWPAIKSGKIAEIIPYVGRRQVLVTWETHAKVHLDYVMTMRKRMNAIVDAYLARDKAPLLALRDDLHVDYLIVNESDLTADKSPKYFSPFDERAKELWDANKGKDFIVLKLAKTASVYSRDGIDIIDLHKL